MRVSTDECSADAPPSPRCTNHGAGAQQSDAVLPPSRHLAVHLDETDEQYVVREIDGTLVAPQR